MEKTKKADNVAVDSEEEVFFNTKRNCPESTSTPAPLPARTRKRKRKTTSSSAKMPNNSNKKNPLGENEEAEMYSDDSDCSNAKSRRTSEEGESLKTFMSRMTREMAVMNTNFLGMNDHIRTTVAEAVEPFSTKLDANNRRIDRIEHKQRTELESMKIKIDNLTKLYSSSAEQKSQPNSKTASYATAASEPARLHFELGPSEASRSCEDWYWSARR